jgi:hypothetical protein
MKRLKNYLKSENGQFAPGGWLFIVVCCIVAVLVYVVLVQGH